MESSYDRMKELTEFDNSKAGVKGLVDAGITTIPKFFIHSQQTSSISSSLELPIIDLSGVSDPNKRPQIIHQIREASRTWGFFQIINHSIPVSVLNSTMEAIKSFHEQPLDIRKQHYRRGRAPVTYSSNFDLFSSKAASWRDTLNVFMVPEAPKSDEIPAICRQEVVAWAEHVEKLGDGLSELLCEGIGLKATKLKELKCVSLRAILGHYYPYCPQPDLTTGIPSHTDIGVITVLLQNQVPGLQVKHGDVWVDVKPVEGALVINIGDFLQMIFNDRYKSGAHRVLANSFQEPRVSVVAFLSATNNNYYEPLEELVSLEKPPLYRKFSATEIKEKFDNTQLADMSLFQYFKL